MRYPIPNYGDLFTIHEFVDMVNNGVISNDDGTGYYANASSYFRNLIAKPSDIAKGVIRIGDGHLNPLTHVLWFNK